MAGERVVIPIEMGVARAFLLKGERSVLVDTGYRRAASRLFRGLQRAGVRPEDLALILITHGHDDHFGNINRLRELSRAPVAIHRLDADSLRTGIGMALNPRGALGSILKLILPTRRRPSIAGFEPEIIIGDELDLNPYGLQGRAIWTPGHTPGSVSVVLENGEVIISDLLMGSVMTATAPSIAFWAWDEWKSRESVRKLLDLKPRVLYATHGGPFPPAQVARKYG